MLLQLSAQFRDLFLYTAWVGASVTLAPMPTATPTLSVQATAPTGDGWDPAIIAAIITSFVAFGGLVYQTWRTHKMEREKDEMQKEHSVQLELFRRALDERDREKEQEKHIEEAMQREMLMAQNNVTRAVAYRRALHVDPHISSIQILDMERPLEVANIYVHVHVHEDTIMLYHIDRTLAIASEQDPKSFLQAKHDYLEKRVVTAVDPDEAIRNHRCCVIVGDPGAGKTTLLKYLTLAIADGKYPGLSDLPIHVELSGFVYSIDQDILDYAARQWDERYRFPQAEARIYMDAMLKEGKAILLLDALDETVVGEYAAQAEASYQKAWDSIMHLATVYSQACIVVTARKAGYKYHQPLTKFRVVEVMDFRREDIRRFIDNWFRCTQGGRQGVSADDLIARLDQNARIQTLAANPLLLSLIVLVYEAQLDLPHQRAQLYRECVEVLLVKWDAKRNVRRRRKFKSDQKRQLLAEVAWHFQQQGSRYFPEQDLLTEIAHFLPALGLSEEDNRLVLQEITSENGLIKEQAHNLYGFLHLTLQEYFAATAVNDQRFATLISQYANPWWEEVLLLYAGQTSDASPLLLHLLSKDHTRPRRYEIFHTNLLVAGRCLTSSPIIRQRNLREDIIESIIALFLQTSYSHLRDQIVEVLCMIGGDSIISRLVALFEGPRIDLPRRSIASVLRKLGVRSMIPNLVEMLKDNRIPERVRRSIAEALGQLEAQLIVPNLMEMLKDGQIADGVCSGIALGLGQLGEQSVASDLMALLKDSQVADEVRGNVALALGQLGEQSVASDLMALLKDSQVADEVRGNVALALGQLGEQSVASDLMALLKDSQVADEVRGNVALALGQLGEQSVASDLMALLKDSQVADEVRSGVALALGQLGERSVIPDLLILLKSTQVAATVRRSIALALGQLGDESVVPDLMTLLKNTQVTITVRGEIAGVLGRLGGQLVVPDLLILLRNFRLPVEVRRSIALALGLLGNRLVVPDLVEILRERRITDANS